MGKIHIRNLYIHIGSHKTGSTYLQKFFYDNEILLSINGIVYPKAGCGGLFGQHDLVAGLKGDNKLFDDIVHSIGDEIHDNSDSLLLSSENFEYLTRPEIERLIGVFEFDNVKVIYFYRTWSPLLYSMWQEEIKHGSIVTYDNYALRHMAFPFSSKLLNYTIALQEYENVVGKENLSIGNYEISKRNNLLSVMLTQINAKITPDNTNRDFGLNASFDPFLVEIIRMMNVFAHNAGFNPSYKPKHYYINNARKGEIGESRHKKILEFMNNHKVQSLNFNNSYAFRLLINNFIDIYMNCFIDEVSCCDDLLDIDTNPLFTISQNYLCCENSVNTLFSAWNDIKHYCFE